MSSHQKLLNGLEEIGIICIQDHIDTYIDEKTSRIIKEILKNSIELPTVEQAKLYIKN